MQFINPGDRFAPESNNNVALPEAGTACRTARLDASDQHSVVHCQPVEPDDSRVDRHVLAGNPDPTAPDAAFLDQPRRHELGGVAGDGKTNPLGRSE